MTEVNKFLDSSEDDIEIIEVDPIISNYNTEVEEDEPVSSHKEASILVEDADSTQVETSEDEDFSPVEYTEWNTSDDFSDYIVANARKLPPVFDNSKSSMIRAFAYLEKLSEELTQGLEQDASYAELNEEQLTTLDTIEEGIQSSLHELSASISGQKKLKKIATKSSSFVYHVNPFIFGLARVLINGKVSQGKNIESLYATLDSRYKLNDREKLELYFTLNDMGHNIRSSFVDHVDMAEIYST